MDRNSLLESLKQDLYRILEIIGELRAKQSVPAPIYPPLPTPAIEPITQTPKHSTAWCGGLLSERLAMYGLATQVCISEGLSQQMTANLLATIYGESGYNQWCVNEQTKDYGIAQFSARYYLKEYNMTPQEAIDNPRRCLEIMARNFKAGRASNWVAYSSGGYKRWLGKKPV